MTLRIPGTKIILNGKATISLGALLLAISGLLANYVWAQVTQVPGLVQWKTDQMEFVDTKTKSIDESLHTTKEDLRVIRDDNREWRAVQTQWNKLIWEEIRDTRKETNAKLDKLIEKQP